MLAPAASPGPKQSWVSIGQSSDRIKNMIKSPPIGNGLLFTYTEFTVLQGAQISLPGMCDNWSHFCLLCQSKNTSVSCLISNESQTQIDPQVSLPPMRETLFPNALPELHLDTCPFPGCPRLVNASIPVWGPDLGILFAKYVMTSAEHEEIKTSLLIA